MYKIFNSKILYLIPIVFLIIITFRISYSYHDINEQAYNFAKTEADVLNSHALSSREYYQNLFLNNIIKLDITTLAALPAYSSSPISKNFSQNNPFNIQIKTVSDRARNPLNNANEAELKAINYFNNNKDKGKYFTDEYSDFYQYASVLKIKKQCLTCHGKKEDAPKFIQKKYNKAYDYKLGDTRGIMSIKIPKDHINQYFFRYFIYSVIYDLFIFLALFFAIYYLVNKSKQINEFLEQEVTRKTKQLKNSLVIDRLTKLPNRLQLLEDISLSVKAPSKHLALLNIDRFKEINGFYGLKLGDKLLKHVAKSIKEFCSNKDGEVYKLPSDEYVLFTTTNMSHEKFKQIISNLISTIEETTYQVENNSITITLSSGIASNIDGILVKANMALQISKNSKNSLVAYDDSLDTTQHIESNIKAVELLKDALENDYLTPFYQPIYNIQTNKIEKYETLARIVNSNGDIIPPLQFLDIAIKSKLYPHITEIILNKSFDFFKDKNYEFSINLSINDITNRTTNKFIMDKLKNYNNSHRVVFELLESDKIGNYEELREFITEIKKYGCKIAIDDFGSGYSNFSHILELNIDYLKIDASLVKYITTDETSKKITQTIINFASNLDIKTIAEYVEDEVSLNLLKEMDVDFVQGYYIGKPQSGLIEE